MSYSGLGAQAATVQGERVVTNAVQAWLRALGYNVRIDGVYGTQTRDALAQYAARKGRSVLLTAIDGNRTLVFPYNDPLLKALRLEGSAAASRRPVTPPGVAPDGSGTPTPPSVEPPPSPYEEPSIFVRDSIIGGVPNWAIFGGVAAGAGYLAWRMKKRK